MSVKKLTHLQKHRELVHLGHLIVGISKEQNKLEADKPFCPVCGQEYESKKLVKVESLDCSLLKPSLKSFGEATAKPINSINHAQQTKGEK